MRCSRRDFLKLAALPAAATLLSRPLLRAMFAPVGGGTKNLVLIDLRGGCDGLNLVVPYGVSGGTYSSVFRQSLAIPANQVLQLGGGVGLNPKMTALKGHFDAGRLAVVQGVSYPEPNYSHEIASTIWQSGDVSGFATQGWLAKHLAAMGGPGPSAVAVDDTLTLLLDGSGGFVPAFTDKGQFVFPADPYHTEDMANRRAAYQAIAAGLSGSPKAELASMSSTTAGLLNLIDAFEAMPELQHVSSYPQDSSLADMLKLVAELLNGGLGLRYFHVPFGGWDTHADQESDHYHSDRLGEVSDCMSAFREDLAAVGLAQDTLVVVFSEFGRTVHQNGSKGTDHGSVNPVLVFGDGVTGGLITPHPAMDPDNLTEDGELPMVADFRDVFGTIVQDWLGGSAAVCFPSHALADLAFVA
jgi:uncharacterized protein (DUF1501 family)